jgi:hypothetical protein
MQPQQDPIYTEIETWRQDATKMESDAMLMMPTIQAMQLLGVVQDAFTNAAQNPLSPVAEIQELWELQSLMENQIASQ